MIQDKMVRARRQYHHQHHNHPITNHQQQPTHHHRHALNHFHRSNKRLHVPNAPSNTTQFIMNDHELIEPDFDLMHNAIMEHYNKSKKRKLQHEQQSDESRNITSSSSPEQTAKSADKQQSTADTTTTSGSSESPTKSQFEATKQQTATSTAATKLTTNKSPLRDLDDHGEELENKQQQWQQQQQQQLQRKYNQCDRQTTLVMTTTTTTQLQESTNQSSPTTPTHRPTTGSPGDEDGLSPFINHEHLQNEFQEVYTNIHTERLSSMSKNQLVDKYLLLEERVEELENRLRESQTASAAGLG